MRLRRIRKRVKIEPITPHGMCAGVNAAIRKALELKDVYCLHELVHNEIVTAELKDLGFKFTDDINSIPDGETVVFSAHGVSPKIRQRAAEKHLKIVDTTCPFVAKAHKKARDAAERGDEVIVLGNRDHVEVKGILGECEKVKSKGEEVKSRRCTIVAQTTLNVDEVKAEVKRLERTHKISEISWPCNATKERQDAVRAFKGDAVLVLGSATSSNTKRLKEVAEMSGKRAFLAGDLKEVSKLDFSGVKVLGVTSGASTPERFFMETMRFLRHVPEHVAIIMDGNGRWATQRGKKRGEGHIAGSKTLGKVLKWCGDKGIKYLTVYAFSTENWKRPKEEVDGLMKLFVKVLKAKTSDFMKNRVRFRMIGRRGDLPAVVLKEIERLEVKTAAFERQLLVAISYGGRAEIVDAVNAAIERGEKLTEETFRNYLYAPDVPDPDLVIRTSGEVRTSNFLLWETAYSEYYFTDTLWPDFSEADLDAALESYASRHRRKGGV